jgi:hypothetical protein
VNAISDLALRLQRASSQLGKRAAALSRPASLASVALFAIAAGVGLRWSGVWLVAAALSLVIATMAARSIGRALLSMFAAIGLIAGVLWLLATFAPGTAESLHITWGVVAIGTWLLTVFIAVCWRSVDSEASYSLVELIAT